jgi:hypothetical protein
LQCAAQVEWSTPPSEPEPDKFVLEMHCADAQKWEVAYEGPEKRFTVTGLKDAHRYSLRLCCKINGDMSAWDQTTVYTAVPRKRLIMGAARYLIGILRSFGGKQEWGVSELRGVTDRALHFFEQEGDPNGSGTWVGASDRTLSTLLLKLVDDGQWSTLQGLVCNPMLMTRFESHSRRSSAAGGLVRSVSCLP